MLTNRNFKLIPGNIFRFSIFQINSRSITIGDVVVSNHHRIAFDRNLVLIILFIFVQSIIVVHIFNIGQRCSCSSVIFSNIACIWRVSFSSVVPFVTRNNVGSGLIVIRGFIKTVVIAGRVVQWRELVILHALTCSSVYFCFYFLHIVAVSWKLKLILGGQSV